MYVGVCKVVESFFVGRDEWRGKENDVRDMQIYVCMYVCR